MRSIKAKLALFVSCLCVLLVALVWLLTVALFEPAYEGRIRRDLAAQLTAVSAALDEGAAQGESLSALFERVKPLVRGGVCVDISASPGLSAVTGITPYQALFALEGMGDSCLVHSSAGLFSGGSGWNCATAILLRQTAAEAGAVQKTVTDPTGRQQQMVAGTVTASGYVVLASAGLERVDQALQVLSRQLPVIAALLLAVSAVAAALFARWFTRPVTRLSDAAKQVAAGNYDVLVPPATRDELGDLTRDFNHMTSQIARASALQRELVANFSHDLRTPLTLIQGYAETIRDLDGEDPHRREADCRIIIEEAGRLGELVNSMLELSRYSSGAQKPQPEPFDLAELAADVLRRYQDAAQKEGFALCRQGLCPAPVRADPQQIGRVLHNLISNALAHLQPGGQVTVELSAKDGAVRVQVQDNGCGIDEKELPFLFDRYYRARSDAGKKGSGLGLSIVKAILVAHGAPFGVQSAPGAGALFWFELPQAEGEEAGPGE